MNYYKAITASGHCGVEHSDELVIYLEAASMMDALRKAKSFPSVKHHRTPNVTMISKAEYDANIKVSAYDRRNHTI